MLIKLDKKTILIGITGSISIYKICELIRLFKKSNAEVYIVMTENATKFISPLLFEGLSRNRVLYKNSESWSSYLNHIDIGKKCDIFLIAPATGNTINKIANGISDNILLQTTLAFTKNILIAPSANTNMLFNKITEESIKKLLKLKYIFIKSQNKILACGDKGYGALAEPKEIFYEVAKYLLLDNFWIDREVIVTGGGTIEKIDEVRYISNFSSGKMANSLVTALYLRGAKIIFLTSSQYENIPKNIKIVEVKSSEDIYRELNINIENLNRKKKPYLFMVSAVSDFIPTSIKGKIKKENKDNLLLNLKKNIDILSTINNQNLVLIGFKVEMNQKEAIQNATNSLINKKLDAICLNIFENSNNFGKINNNINFITKFDKKDLGIDKKINLAFKILDEGKKIIHD